MKLELKNINHSYSSNNLVLKNISLTLKTGVTGIIGINGAGKSSLLNILATEIKPKSGIYQYNNKDCIKTPIHIRKILGYLPQNAGFLNELCVKDFVKYIGILKGCSSYYLNHNIDRILNSLNLFNHKKSQIKDLSGGMKQRVGIAQAIINNPKLLIFDEPVIGLDPNERYSFNLLISEFSKDSIILISSHIIEDIENICENVVILDKGEILYNGNILFLIENLQNMVFEKKISRKDFYKFENANNIIRSKPIGNELLVRYISRDEIDKSNIVKPTLEDAFILKTKQL